MPEYFDSKSSKPKKTKKRRYQSGRTVNPRAAGVAAARRNRRIMPTPSPTPSPTPFYTDPPRGWSAGGEVETDSYGKYTIARGSGAARPQKFRKDG